MRVLLVDLSGILRAMWHASSDKPTSHTHDHTLGLVRRASAGFDRVVLACDSGRSFRKDISAAYKAQRDRPDATMLEQFRRTTEALGREGYAVCAAPVTPTASGDAHFEADDVIATLTEQLATCGFAVEILSSDKDLLALVRDEPVVVRVRHWQKDGRLVGPAEIMGSEKYAVRPDQIRDFLALCGDTSDGVQGVPKVGPKTASDLLRRYDDIAGIVANLDATDDAGKPIVTPVIRENIRAAAVGWPTSGALAVSRDLVTLRRDVPLDLDALLAKRDPQPQRPDFARDAPPERDNYDNTPDEEDPSPELPAPREGSPRESGTAPVPSVGGGSSPSDVASAGGGPASYREETPGSGHSSSALVVAPAAEIVDWSRMIEPRTPGGAHWLAKQMFESRLFSGYGNNGAQSPEAVLALIYAGRELGIGAVASLRGLNIIRGKVSMAAMLMVGLCLSRGAAEFFELESSSAERATWATKRRGRERVHRVTYTLQQAKDAGLYPGKRGDRGEPTMWEKDTENMLVQRAASRLARRVYPDVLMGAAYTIEELQEDPT